MFAHCVWLPLAHPAPLALHRRAQRLIRGDQPRQCRDNGCAKAAARAAWRQADAVIGDVDGQRAMFRPGGQRHAAAGAGFVGMSQCVGQELARQQAERNGLFGVERQM